MLPNGNVFCASRLVGYDRCTETDPCTGAVTESVALPADDIYAGFDATAVLLPLLPVDGYKARILVCGGTVARRVNLDATGEAAGWKPVMLRNGSAAGKERRFACAVLLPTGQVLVTGGVLGLPVLETGVMEPEMYSPAIDWGSGTYRDVADPQDDSDRFDTVEEPSPVVRNYHSTALLMPDGRVWTAGSSISAKPGDPATQDQLRIHIFAPPYPAGQRPRITDAPRSVGYGDRFVVNTPDAEAVGRVALLRCGSMTHAFDSDQRYVGLTFQVANPSALEVTAPPIASVAPPGEYMLFLVDTGGRPCEYARFVRLVDPGRQVTAGGIGSMLAKVTVPETSDHGPAVVTDGTRVFLAWTGAGNPNLNVMISTDQAATFVGKHVSGHTSPHAPAMAVRGSEIFLAWTGEGDGNLNVIVSTDGALTWRGKAVFPETSEGGPAIAAHECDRVHLAWRGAGNEQLNIAQLALTAPPSEPSVTGLMQKRILPDRSDHAPALASRDVKQFGSGPLILGWTGEGAQLLNLAAPADTAGYRKVVLGQDSSDDGPSVACHRDRVLLAWRGSGSEHLNVATIGRVGRKADPLTDGLDRFATPPSSTRTRFQAGSMLNGRRRTTVTNLSPTQESVLDIGSGQLKLVLGVDHAAPLQIAYGHSPGRQPSAGLGLDLRGGGADRIRVVISRVGGAAVSITVGLFTARAWYGADATVGSGVCDFRFSDFTGSGDPDLRAVNHIVCTFQVLGSLPGASLAAPTLAIDGIEILGPDLT